MDKKGTYEVFWQQRQYPKIKSKYKYLQPKIVEM